MRIALAALALLTLAACDSAEPGDALLGTWSLTGVTSELRVTSATAQTIPDLTARPTSTLAVSGTVSADLTEVPFIIRSPDGYSQLEAHTPDDAAERAELYLFGRPVEDDRPERVGVQLNHEDDGGFAYGGEFSGEQPFVQQGARFTIPTRTLLGGPNAEDEATVGGTVTFPEIDLTPGASIDVQPYEESLDGTLTFSFLEDGAFEARVAEDTTETAVGTWELVGEDQVRVSVTQGDLFDSVTFDYTVEGGALVLTATNLDPERECADACLDQIAADLFAAEGSLASVDYLSTLRFGSRTQASARTGEGVAPTRLQRRATLPIVGPLVSASR